MILEQVPAVQRLSPDEKWQLIDELWEELLPRSDSEPQPEILALIEGRMAEYRKNPALAAPWAEVKAPSRRAASDSEVSPWIVSFCVKEPANTRAITIAAPRSPFDGSYTSKNRATSPAPKMNPTRSPMRNEGRGAATRPAGETSLRASCTRSP